MIAFSDLAFGGPEVTEMLDSMLQQEFKQWDMVLAAVGVPPPSPGKKCGVIRKAYCGHHGLKKLYGIAKKCKGSLKCWTTALMGVMKEEETSGCLSDCKAFICFTISKTLNKAKKYLGSLGVDGELQSIGCPENPSQN